MTLEALKKELPQAVARWGGADTKVKLVRRFAKDEAKIVLVKEDHDDKGKRLPDNDAYMIIYLRYFEGTWTSTRFEASWLYDNDEGKRMTYAIMLAIDQIGEK